MDQYIQAMLKKILVVYLFSCLKLAGQADSLVTLTFDFNEQLIREKDNKVQVKSSNVVLTNDRFGNKASALFLLGTPDSYLNLGTSPLLKSNNLTVSLWVNLNRRNYLGRGYDYNPIFRIRNGPGDDFTNAVSIGYDCYANRLGAGSTLDDRMEVGLVDNEPIKFNKWYHLVFVCNNQFVRFYVDGKLKGHSTKRFETRFSETDSAMIGHSASKKNERFSVGSFDDIQIFHRSLSDKEVQDLYNAPNPNKMRDFLTELLKYGAIILVLGGVIIILIIRNKRALKKQKQQFELQNRISELELKVVKAQMNPHFISNCLVSVQELIYKNEVEKAGQYIARFSYYLRQVLNYSDENYIPLSEELEMAKLYIELEQVRFKNDFNFEMAVDDSVDAGEILIPALVTQPFIENAIWHGLLPLNDLRQPRLVIRARLVNDLPVIEIEDNGVGRDLDSLPGKKAKGTKLVADKIETLNRLSNTSNYKIEIVDLFSEDKKPVGTKIIIQLDTVKE